VRRGNAFGRVCLSVCLSCSCCSFQKPWPRNFILVCGYIFFSKYSGQVHTSRSSGQGQGYKSKTRVCVLFRLSLLNVVAQRLHFSYARTSSEQTTRKCVHLVTLLWPSPWPHDLSTRLWPRYSLDVHTHTKNDVRRSRSSKVRAQITLTVTAFCTCDLGLDLMTLS